MGVTTAGQGQGALDKDYMLDHLDQAKLVITKERESLKLTDESKLPGRAGMRQNQPGNPLALTNGGKLGL